MMSCTYVRKKSCGNIKFIFQKELNELYLYRDLFFENHPLDMASQKNKCVEEKKEVLVEKFESFDGECRFNYLGIYISVL